MKSANIKQFGKLVRDKIPAIIKHDGGIPVTNTLSQEGFKEELLSKLLEEAGEARNASDRDELITELADVKEVFLAILTAHNIDGELVERERKKRARERGSFSLKIYLQYVRTK